MQTILKVVCEGRSQAAMVDDYLAWFCAKAAREKQSVELPLSDDDYIAYIHDDVGHIRDKAAAKPRAKLGSFGPSSNQASKGTQLIFMNPIILSHKPNGTTLRLWVASPSPGPAGNSESE